MEEKNLHLTKKSIRKIHQFYLLKEKKNGNIVTFLGNFSSEVQTIENPSINAIDLFTNNKESSKNLNLKPWGFKILIKE